MTNRLQGWLLAVGFMAASLSPALAQPVTVSGYVEDATTGERIPGTHLYLPSLEAGVTSNQYGFYSLTVNRGLVQLWASHVSYEPQLLALTLRADTMLTVMLLAHIIGLDSVEVTAEGESGVDVVQMSSHNLPVEQIEMLPVILGEVDIQKTLQLLPGVQAGLEGASGLYVRGGRADQNLIQLDGLPLYNPSHLFGLFSVFNSSAIKHVELLKGGFPARYGGRLASVINFTMKEGNMRRFAGETSLGLLTSRLTLEGPLVKERASFLVAGRRTFIDLLTRPFQSRANRIGGHFFDLNAKANIIASDRDRLYVSLFSGRDGISVRKNEAPRFSGKANEFLMDVGWRNQLASVRWNRLISSRIFANLLTGLTGYRYHSSYAFKEGERGGQLSGLAHTWSTRITDWTTRLDLEYARSLTHYWRFGGEAIVHRFLPGSSHSRITDPDRDPVNLLSTPTEPLHSLEMAAYAENEMQPHPQLKLNAGLRLSAFSARGAQHHSVEPRLAINWRLNESTAVKASGMHSAQFTHLLSSGGASLPTDIWIPTQKGISPQRGYQLAVGLVRNIADRGFELSVEAYTKRMHGVLEYSDGARSYFAAVLDWPDLIESGRGASRGLEIFGQKKKGRLKGWAGYAWARTTRKFSELNGGSEFPDSFDRRHDASIVAQYWLSDRTHISAAWVYGSGYPVWVPVGAYYLDDSDYSWPLFDYEQVNAGRAPSYHRLDLSIRFIKKKKRGERAIVLGLYNAYNRKNPMFVYPKFDSAYVGDVLSGYTTTYNQVSLLQMIPAVSWQIKF